LNGTLPTELGNLTQLQQAQQKLALQNGREIEKQIIFFDQPKNKRD